MEKSAIKCPDCNGNDPDCTNCDDSNPLKKGLDAMKQAGVLLKALKSSSINSIAKRARAAQAVEGYEGTTAAPIFDMQPVVVFGDSGGNAPGIFVHKSGPVSAHSAGPDDSDMEACKSCGLMKKGQDCRRCKSAHGVK